MHPFAEIENMQAKSVLVAALILCFQISEQAVIAQNVNSTKKTLVRRIRPNPTTAESFESQ